MTGSRFAVVCAATLLLGFLLAGCDIQAEQRLTDDPIGGNPPGTLDETSDENIVAYFYAGKPVKGLVYSCGLNGLVQYTGSTDENGRFVCPRDTTASFFVGVALRSTMKIGQVDLGIFGGPSVPGNRNFVVITPGTLYGTTSSGSRAEVANIFNLLHSLDTSFAGQRLQAIIDLEQNMLSDLIEKPEFASIVAAKITRSISDFDGYLKPLVLAINTTHPLVLATQRPEAPTLGSIESVDVANAALLRAREGLYRSNSTMLDSKDSAVFFGTAEFMVGADGFAKGFTVTQEYFPSTSTSIYTLSILDLVSGARVLADGSLQGFSFGFGTSKQLDLFGTLVNDALVGESRLCNPDSPNATVPAMFCSMDPLKGGYTLLDAGVFESALEFDGELFVGMPVSGRPDIDLDNLPQNYLPRTYELGLSRYTDIDIGDMIGASSANYDGVGEEKEVFGTLEALPGGIRYTLMPNGDVVSDRDSDCRKLALVGGLYEDADGTREFLIGRVGNVFKVELLNTDTPEDPNDKFEVGYLDFYLNILDPAHPNYGFTAGVSAFNRQGLHQMVLVEKGLDKDDIRSKSCDPTASAVCNHKVEWFNSVLYQKDVVAIDNATPSDVTAADRANYKNVVYYGQVTGNTRVASHDPNDDGNGVFETGDICRP